MADQTPSDAPPSYSQATGKGNAPARSSNAAGPSSAHLQVPGAQNGIPADHRRSMEDLTRPLPPGWVRTYDPESSHQFYVDTTADPPRSIWTHPYDDEIYLRGLSSEERERVEQESLRPHPSKADIAAEHTDEEDYDDHHLTQAGHGMPDLPPRPDGKGKGKPTFGRKLKDKLTGMTHEEREQERLRRAELEQRAYEQHMRLRTAMSKAAQTGQPQLLGKDKDGKDVYVEPPQVGMGYGGYGRSGFPGNPGASYYNPYGTGVYATPNARYLRPPGPYQRPYGGGYGGGYGMPLALGGGLLGGAMLGGMMF